MFVTGYYTAQAVSNFLSKIFAFSREEKRISSSEFEAAVNAALLSDTVADATKGPFISEEGALNLSAVWACVRILSKPNSYTSRFALLHHLMVSCTLWGNGYARTTLQSVLANNYIGSSFSWLSLCAAPYSIPATQTHQTFPAKEFSGYPSFRSTGWTNAKSLRLETPHLYPWT